MSTCAVVSLFHNCASRSDAFLKSFAENTKYPHVRQFFVNNGSKDVTQKLLLGYKKATVINVDQNLGVPGGRNVAIKAILDNHRDVNYICFVDNDIDFTEGWLQNMITLMNKNPNVGIVGPVTNSSTNPIQDISRKRTIPKKLFAMEAGFSKDEFAITARVDGFCMLVHRNVVNNLGYFDTNFTTVGYEDWDYCRRAKQLGIGCGVSLRTFVSHDGALTLKQNNIKTNFMEGNKHRYMMKWESTANKDKQSVFIPITNINNHITINATEPVGFRDPLPHKKSETSKICTPQNQQIRSLTDLSLACYIKKADGLGKIGIKLFENLMQKNLKIHHQKLNVYDMAGVPQVTRDNLTKYPMPSNVVLLTNQPFYLDQISKFQRAYIYTMFESTQIPSDWAARINQKIDEVFVPDEYQRRSFLNSGVKKPIKVIPLGVELEHYQYKPRRQDNVFVFGFSGMFTQRKNVRDLIRSFTHAFPPKQFPKVRLKIHGRWGCMANSKRQFNSVINGDSRVKVDEGVMDLGAFKRWWDEIDCYVFPSKGEGFSLTPREAIAQGIPTIVSNYSGHEELVKSGHFYSIEPRGEEPAFYEFIGKACGHQAKIAIDDIMEQMKHVYNNYDAALEKAKRGSVWIKKQPSWAQVTNMIVKEIMPENMMVCDTLENQCGVGDFTRHVRSQMQKDNVKFVGNMEYAMKIAESRKTKRIHIQHEYSIYNSKPMEQYFKRLKELGVKITLTMHSVLNNASHLNFNGILAKYADEIFTLNPLGASALRNVGKRFNPEKIKFIHHPCYEVHFNSAKVKKGLIGTFGFLHGQKGYNYLMEAVMGTPHKLRLLCNGDPNHPKFIAPYRGKVDFQHINEFQKFNTLLSRLSACEIIVIPSVNHPNGMFGASGSVRVAITSGRPIICTTATHFAEFSNEMPKALQKNVIDLKDKINSLMGNEEKQQQIIQTLKEYKEQNSMKNFCDNYRKSFQE